MIEVFSERERYMS